ncbi:MAG TPA: hypothetical protein VE715_17170 [Blastocatellia bacterium]|nr:hypothetical protein [Blastocatellia bacterium]
MLTVFILASIILFSHLGQGGLAGYDDAFYAHEGKQMLITGDWWNVRFNGSLNFEYPPMFMWLEALKTQDEREFIMEIGDYKKLVIDSAVSVEVIVTTRKLVCFKTIPLPLAGSWREAPPKTDSRSFSS